MAKRTSIRDRQSKANPVNAFISNDINHQDDTLVEIKPANASKLQDDNPKKIEPDNTGNLQNSNTKNVEIEYEPKVILKKQTYTIDDEVIDALNFYVAFEKKGDNKIDKSDTVRKALKAYIPQKYFDMVQEQKKG